MGRPRCRPGPPSRLKNVVEASAKTGAEAPLISHLDIVDAFELVNNSCDDSRKPSADRLMTK